MFVDTSGWAHHRDAARLIKGILRAGDTVLTSNYGLAELSALLMSPLSVPGHLRLVLLTRIRSAAWVQIAHVDSDLDAASWDYLNSREDKEFSLVDCSSFVIMGKRRISDALTADRHFEQAGYTRLLKL